MRIAILSDIHSNLSAFEAVIADAESGGSFDQLWCLGDLVGYGPEPGGCISLLRGYPHICVTGNHDRAAAGLVGPEDFNLDAKLAILWTASQLSDSERSYLALLPEVVVEGEFTLVHGSLREPLWEYLVSEAAAGVQLGIQTTPYSLIGHSHLQLAFFEEELGAPRGQLMESGQEVYLGGRRLIANPGSVGQPRDGDPRAGYALLDTEAQRLTYCRVPYEIARTQRAMLDAGLPQHLIERLAVGR